MKLESQLDGLRYMAHEGKGTPAAARRQPVVRRFDLSQLRLDAHLKAPDDCVFSRDLSKGCLASPKGVERSSSVPSGS